jgi:succinate dehydrogenase flavin-adding protein (antitoxin of CptAB toxin-antitoxin module)
MAGIVAQQNIIGILGIESLPDERKIAILEKATDLVQKRLMLRILDSLSEEQQEAFGKLLDSEDQEGVNRFLAENVPAFSDWIQEEVYRLKEELADLAGGIE